MDLKELYDTFKQRTDMYFLEGASAERIKEFEDRNGISLPVAFKEWLKICDGGEFYLPAGLQLYGVAHKPVIEVNAVVRPDDSYIVIGALASGDPIVCRSGEERISIYNREGDRIEDDETYEDFYTFINSLGEIVYIEE